MSIKLMTAVWDMDNITSTQKLVLLALADWANDDGLCWPSVARLAKKSSLGERTVQTTIKSLVDVGMVEREEIVGKGNRYWIRMDTDGQTPAKSAPPQNTALTPAKSAPNTLKIHQLDIRDAPPWLPVDAWLGWVMMRKAIKKPLTDRAIARALNKLEAMHQSGHDIEKVLDQSTTHCWSDLYPVKENTNGKANRFDTTRTFGAADGIGDALNRRLGLG